MAGILDFLLDPKAVPFYFDPNNDMNEANDTLAKIEEKHVRTLEKLPDYLLVEGDGFIFTDAFGTYIHNLSIAVCENEYRLIKRTLDNEDFDILFVNSEYFRRAVQLPPLFYHRLDDKDVPVFDYLRKNILVKLTDSGDIFCISVLCIPTEYTIEMMTAGFYHYCLTYDKQSSKEMYEVVKEGYDNLSENIKDAIDEFAGIYKEKDTVNERMFPFGPLSMTLCNSLFYHLEIDASVKVLERTKEYLKEKAIC